MMQGFSQTFVIDENLEALKRHYFIAFLSGFSYVSYMKDWEFPFYFHSTIPDIESLFFTDLIQ